MIQRERPTHPGASRLGPTLRGRRASVILAVMVVMAIALLVVIGMLALVRGEVAAASSAPRTAQSRAMAWSGLQVIGATLDRQRDRILEGDAPTLRAQYTLVEDDRRLGVVRLLAFGPDGQTLIPEAGKVDLNSADAEALVGIGLVDEALARRIIEHRDRLPDARFQSELDLLAVPGVDAELLYGDVERLVLDPRVGIPRGSAQAPRAVTVIGLIDAVTVHGIEPAIQRSGARRINLNRPWSDELGARVDERFGAGSSTLLRQVLQTGTAIDREQRIAEVLGQFRVPPADWADVLDAFTTEEGDLHGGRLDLNSASIEALTSLPGITPSLATQIVRERDGVHGDERSSPTWPMLREILTQEQFGAIAHRLSVRSWTWRVRLAAGEVDAEDPDGPLTNPVVWEAVIDLTAPAWRVAYLRDATLLPLAATMRSPALDESDDELDDELDDSGEAGTDSLDSMLTSPGSGSGSGSASGSGSSFGSGITQPVTPTVETPTVVTRRARPTPRATPRTVSPTGGNLQAGESESSPSPPPPPPKKYGVGRHRN